MSKFQIGELVKIKNEPMADEVCVIIGYVGIRKFSGEQRYCLRLYGGDIIEVPFRESNLERSV